MSNKQKKRDILEELLNNPAAETPPELEELACLIHQHGQEAQGARDGIEKSHAIQPNRKLSLKKKTTCYLSKNISENLDKAKTKIREMAPAYLKNSISKSQILGQALRVILKDFEVKGKNSVLVKQILKKPKAFKE